MTDVPQELGGRARFPIDQERLINIKRMIYEAPACEMKEMGMDLLAELWRQTRLNQINAGRAAAADDAYARGREEGWKQAQENIREALGL